MAWVAADLDGMELVFEKQPARYSNNVCWFNGLSYYDEEDGLINDCVSLPAGSIARLIGRALSWEDEPVELK